MARRVVTAFSLFAIVALVCVGVADAKKKRGRGRSPDKVFAGKIITSKKRLPTAARSKGAYISKLKKANESKFWENKAKKEWKIYYGAFFKRPVDDLEVTVKLYDYTEGNRKMVSSFEVYLERRGETALISYVELERKFFGVNRKIYMTVEDHRGKVLASGTFQILGEGEKFKGNVDFTQEDTTGDINY